MATDTPTHHQRVLAHLRDATKALEEHRKEMEAAQRAHVTDNAETKVET